jgi:hypothetical protein
MIKRRETVELYIDGNNNVVDLKQYQIYGVTAIEVTNVEIPTKNYNLNMNVSDVEYIGTSFGTLLIPEGYYDSAKFASMLQNILRTQSAGFTVVYENQKIVISNTVVFSITFASIGVTRLLGAKFNSFPYNSVNNVVTFDEVSDDKLPYIYKVCSDLPINNVAQRNISYTTPIDNVMADVLNSTFTTYKNSNPIVFLKKTIINQFTIELKDGLKGYSFAVRDWSLTLKLYL